MNANAPLRPGQAQSDFTIAYPVTADRLGVENGGTPVAILPPDAGLINTPKCEICRGYLDGAGHRDSCRCGRKPTARVVRVRRPAATSAVSLIAQRGPDA